MIAVLGNVLGEHELAALRGAAAKLRFGDGRATAGRYARAVKHNEQAAADRTSDAILEKVRTALMAHEVFRSVARPRKFVRLILSRYGPGMDYGAHVDDAVMAGARTDLSFTLPLSDPGDYDGGALVMEDAVESRAFRPAAGDAVLYPTSATHRVAPVTRGTRLAVVGWVQSWVRDPARREALHDLDVAAAEMFAATGKTDGFDRLLKAKTNLYRMWAEG